MHLFFRIFPFHHISLTWPPCILISGSLGFSFLCGNLENLLVGLLPPRDMRSALPALRCLKTAISCILSHSLLYYVEGESSPCFSIVAGSGILESSFLIAQFSFYLLGFIFHMTVGSSGFHPFQQYKPSRNSF